MTFGLSRDYGTSEWAGTSLSSIFAQRRNIFEPGMWRMIFDIVRFNDFAPDMLQEGFESENDPAAGKSDKDSKSSAQKSIGDYLDREGYSQGFRDD